MNREKCTAVVLAAGKGSRMGTKIQKQYLEICGKPVLYYSLAAFAASPIIDEIVLVTGEGKTDYCRKNIIEAYGITKVNKIVVGGKERYESVYKALREIEPEGYVFIHDGARPFVDESIIERTYQAVKEYRACVAGMPSKDTVKIVDENDFAVNTPERRFVWCIQTPQVFETALIRHAYFKLMENEEKEQEQKRKIELKALQSQINPHFLYNTLDSIIWMAEGKKNEEVVIMTASLARLLRQSISNEDELVTVGQEIEYVRSYLTIQKMRYKDKLEFEIKADPSITQVPIIRLVLQPLVENAIYHGLKYKDSKGLLTVHGYMKGENAVIDITDDGVGMDEETLKHIYDKHKVNYRSNGVGVYNVQQRLVLYYGKDYGIIYHSEKGKGTTASVVIPGIQEESHEKS